MTYTVGVTNAGPSHATAVEVTDEIPAGATFVERARRLHGRRRDGHVHGADARRRRHRATYPIVLGFPAGVAPGAVANTATATSATPDPDPANNQQTATVEVVIAPTWPSPGPLVTDPVVAGRPVTYELSVTNNGPNDAPDVVISDTLPTGTTFVSAEPPAGGTCNVVPEDGLTIVGCTIDVLPVGETRTALLTIGTPPDLTGSLANTAFVGSGALDDEPRERRIAERRRPPPATVVAQLDAAVDVVADRDDRGPRRHGVVHRDGHQRGPVGGPRRRAREHAARRASPPRRCPNPA